MSKSRETWSKKEAEKKKQKKRKDKELKKQERKANAKSGSSSFDEMIAYVDEYGRISSTPPDPSNKAKIKKEDIEISVPKKAEEEPMDIIRNGIVTFFNDSKGYGFIKDLETQASVFVHINGLVDKIRENDKVTFEVEMGHRGSNAVKVKLVR